VTDHGAPTATRTRDLPLRRSFRVLGPTAAMLLGPVLLVVLVAAIARGVKLVLARGWHVGRVPSSVGVADPGGTRSALDGFRETPPFYAGAWGAHFSPNPAGAIFGPRRARACSPRRCSSPPWCSSTLRVAVPRRVSPWACLRASLGRVAGSWWREPSADRYREVLTARRAAVSVAGQAKESGEPGRARRQTVSHGESVARLRWNSPAVQIADLPAHPVPLQHAHAM